MKFESTSGERGRENGREGKKTALLHRNSFSMEYHPSENGRSKGRILSSQELSFAPSFEKILHVLPCFKNRKNFFY